MCNFFAMMTFLMAMLIGNFTFASLLITFQGDGTGEINGAAFEKTNREIASLLKDGAIRAYRVSSTDIAGSARICLEFIGCTSRDYNYMEYISDKLIFDNFNPAPKFEISSSACR